MWKIGAFEGREVRCRIDQIDPGGYLGTAHRPYLSLIVRGIGSLWGSGLPCQGRFGEKMSSPDSIRLGFVAVSASA